MVKSVHNRIEGIQKLFFSAGKNSFCPHWTHSMKASEGHVKISSFMDLPLFFYEKSDNGIWRTALDSNPRYL